MTIVGITGHQNIPKNAQAFISAEIERQLDPFGSDFIGVSSLAKGADQLFAQIVLRQGGHLQAIIPCEKYEATFSEGSFLENYRGLLKKADMIETLEHPEPSEKAFLDAGRKIVDLSQFLIAVWDGQEAKGEGGTADIVKYARERKKEVAIVWSSGLSRE